MTTRLLRLDASHRGDASVSRRLTDRIADRFSDAGAEITERDLTEGLCRIDGAWIGANFTDPDKRTDEQRARLSESDALVAELQAADVVLIGLPVYNFGVPAELKTWIDLVSRRQVTFRYTPEGPEGLLSDKRAIVAVASGSTGLGSEIDFVSGYLRHVLGFIGIRDVVFVAADRMALDGGGAMERAEAAIEALPLAA